MVAAVQQLVPDAAVGEQIVHLEPIDPCHGRDAPGHVVGQRSQRQRLGPAYAQIGEVGIGHCLDLMHVATEPEHAQEPFHHEGPPLRLRIFAPS